MLSEASKVSIRLLSGYVHELCWLRSPRVLGLIESACCFRACISKHWPSVESISDKLASSQWVKLLSKYAIPLRTSFKVLPNLLRFSCAEVLIKFNKEAVVFNLFFSMTIFLNKSYCSFACCSISMSGFQNIAFVNNLEMYSKIFSFFKK